MSNDLNLIKAPYTKEKYTKEQITEFHKCSDPVTGPEYFMSNYFYVQHPTKGSMIYKPYDYQKQLIHNYHNYRYSISMLARQLGKCTHPDTKVSLTFLDSAPITVKISIIHDIFSTLTKYKCTRKKFNEQIFKDLQFTNNEAKKTFDRMWRSASYNSKKLWWDQFKKELSKTNTPRALYSASIVNQNISERHQRTSGNDLRISHDDSYSNLYKSKKFQNVSEPKGTIQHICFGQNERRRQPVLWETTQSSPTWIFGENKNRRTEKENIFLIERAMEGSGIPKEDEIEVYPGNKRKNERRQTQAGYNRRTEKENIFLNERAMAGSRIPEKDDLYWETIRGRTQEENIGFFDWERDNIRAPRENKGSLNREKADARTKKSYSRRRQESKLRGMPTLRKTRKGEYETISFRQLQNDKKFIESFNLYGFNVLSDNGLVPICQSHKTIKYEQYIIKTSDGLELKCADNHIVFDEEYREVFCKDLVEGDQIQTVYGTSIVESLYCIGDPTHMYDIGVDEKNHRYYTNGILSHNSVTAAGYILHYAMFVPDSTVLIAAHKYSGAQEIMYRIRYAYESVPNHIRAGVVSYNKGSVEFDNGSRILSAATTENTGRGLSISLLYMDEFAFVRPSIAKEFWTSISPTLATGGKAIITSTPNSDEDQFAMIWRGANNLQDEYGNETEVGINGFKPFLALWDVHPDRDAKWAREERGKLGDDRFSREHECKFISADELLVDSKVLNSITTENPAWKQGQVRWYSLPKEGSAYLVALDPSLGTGGDNAAIQVFETPSMTQVAEWKHNKSDIKTQVRLMQGIVNHIASVIGVNPSIGVPNVWYTVENNTLGEAALVMVEELGEETFNGIFLSESKKRGVGRRFRKGFNTTNTNKLLACARLKSLLESGKLTIKSKALVSELKTFVASGSSYAAKIGEKDDLVSALLLIIRMSYEIKEWDAELDSILRDRQEDIEPTPFIVL